MKNVWPKIVQQTDVTAAFCSLSPRRICRIKTWIHDIAQRNIYLSSENCPGVLSGVYMFFCFLFFISKFTENLCRSKVLNKHENILALKSPRNIITFFVAFYWTQVHSLPCLVSQCSCWIFSNCWIYQSVLMELFHGFVEIDKLISLNCYTDLSTFILRLLR